VSRFENTIAYFMESVLMQVGIWTLLLTFSSSAPIVVDNGPYDFQNSPRYHALDDVQRRSLDQVHRDFVLLWGALDLYARGHEGRMPKDLESLVPIYLKELPKDAFATEASAEEKDLGNYVKSRDGWGYRYRPGNAGAFVIASAGLPDFPYLAKSGNVGLYIARGTWISGIHFPGD
jgi:hypothetical protein